MKVFIGIYLLGLKWEESAPLITLTDIKVSWDVFVALENGATIFIVIVIDEDVSARIQIIVIATSM